MNDTQKALIKIRKSVMNPELAPMTRFTNAREMLEEFGFTARNIRIAKKLAKQFKRDIAADPRIRTNASNLLKFIDKQTEDFITPAKESPAKEEKEPFDRSGLPVVSRAEQLAKLNARWNGETDADGNVTAPPCKYLHYYTAADLIPFGVPDLDAPDVKYYAPMGDGEFPPYRIVNPAYLATFRAWKQRRFNGELPDRMSVWYGLFEDTLGSSTRPPQGFDPYPETYRGAYLFQHMIKNKQIEKWEYDSGFLRDLWFEIDHVYTYSGRRHDSGCECCKNFIWRD